MKGSIVLLRSGDTSLSDTVLQALESIGHLQLDVVDVLEPWLDHHRDDVALVLMHFAKDADGPDISRLLHRVANRKRKLPVIILGDLDQPQQALTFLRQGAVDYLSRPIDVSRLTFLADVLTGWARLNHRSPAPLKSSSVQALGDRDPFYFIPSNGMGALVAKVSRIASQDVTVLLTGETGTGKTRLARLIHEQSPRRQDRFLAVNCAALSANLIESELFGHVKGSFTGADRNRAGKLAEVGRGTLLLDEIDTLSLELQAKLLRVVEERLFEPVGSNASVAMNARLIIASNRDLENEVSEGRFRTDLFYRLNVVGFYIPPLREVPEMIPVLASRFLSDFSSRNGLNVHSIADQVLQAFQGHHWPGNVRELRNVVERGVALCDGEEIQLEHLPPLFGLAGPALEARQSLSPQVGSLSTPSKLAQSREEIEIACIRQALAKHNNNRVHAAADLGICRMTLYKKLHRYGLIGRPKPDLLPEA